MPMYNAYPVSWAQFVHHVFVVGLDGLMLEMPNQTFSIIKTFVYFSSVV